MGVLMRGCGAAVALALSLAAAVPASGQPSWGERLADRDVALSDIGIASGVWSDGDTVWVSDWQGSGSEVQAYALRGGARRAGLDMAELPASVPAGLWSDGDTLWVSDFSGDALDARRLATGAAVAGRRFAAAGNGAPTGLWSDGSTLWAADYYDRKAYAYALSDGTRRSSRDLALSGTGRPFGLWSDGATLLAADWTGGRVLAYRLSDGSRLTERDIDTSAAGNAKPMGLWSDGTTLWVTDEQDDRLYAYAVPGLLEVAVPTAADPSLASLTLTGVDIGTFASDTTSYAAEVANDVATTTVTAAARGAGARVAISPADAEPATPGHQVALAVGRTVVKVAVTARNGVTRRTYVVAVTSAGWSDATLSSLSLTGVDIGAFAAERLDYAARVPYAVGSTTVAAAAAHGGATVSVTPADADGAAAGHQVRLAVGDTAVGVLVLAEDGTTERAYAVTVTRAAPSSDAALRSLELSGVDLGTFDPDGLSYAASVDYAVSTATATATARDPTATVDVMPADADGEAPGHQVRLAVGATVVEVRVAAQDGTTARTYTATVVRARPADERPVASLVVGADDRVRIGVPSATDRYHVLYYRPDADDPATEHAVAIHPGGELDVELTEPSRAGAGAYRVATYLNSAPGDQDGDDADDLEELGRRHAGKRAPMNKAKLLSAWDGANAIHDMAEFLRLSKSLWTPAGTREFTDFIISDIGTDDEEIYFINTGTWYGHRGFIDRHLSDRPWGSLMRGHLSYYPEVVAPNGELGTFAYSGNSRWSFEDVARAYEVVAANMPFLRNDYVYLPLWTSMPEYRRNKAKYDASRVPVYLEEDLAGLSAFDVLNAAVGYGLLRVLGSDERPTFRDVVILRHLPNELSAVAGVISLERQTPLSHVNLRAVQDGVPNAYVGDALEDPMVANLIGKYVRYEVADGPGKHFEWTNPATGAVESRFGHVLTEATAEQVAAHHEARRPAEAQTPARDLTVTAYRALGSVAFADADAFGVKAANLATLRTLGLTDVEVPDGYALPFHYYDAFMKHNGFYDDVDALLADADFQGGIAVRDQELRKLRRRIENAAVPEWMATSLGTLQGLFAEGVPIRCRSSTNNEDLPGFSGAGLYDSVTHRPGEGHLSKSVKQVFASLWNLRAFEEREFHRIDHKAAAMGVLMHPNFDGELANGVAVSDDPVYLTEDAYYVNAQVGENLVTNPSSAVVPEELLLTAAEDGEDGEYEEAVVQRSSLVADDARVLEAAHVATLYAALGTIHERFAALYEVGDDDEFSMEIEFKVTAADALAIKQARPWVY